jgi:hypothetical protein
MYNATTNNSMSARKMCFDCNFWQDVVESAERGDHQYVIDNGQCYVAMPPEYGGGFKGFGGMPFLVTMTDSGEQHISNNLWYKGVVPDEFKDLLPNNAIITEYRSYK